ncbi:hypothetical protein, partial [Klebsiella pneumoniae]|uniref:hypothetical protein n=1 Tax=Klebsiella pneumoniae TaxID=573 RepID=UPI001C8F8257
KTLKLRNVPACFLTKPKPSEEEEDPVLIDLCTEVTAKKQEVLLVSNAFAASPPNIIRTLLEDMKLSISRDEYYEKIKNPVRRQLKLISPTRPLKPPCKKCPYILK